MLLCAGGEYALLSCGVGMVLVWGGVLWAHYWGVRLHVRSFPPGAAGFVVGGFGCGGVVCQLHSGREHLVSNFLLQIVQ